MYSCVSEDRYCRGNKSQINYYYYFFLLSRTTVLMNFLSALSEIVLRHTVQLYSHPPPPQHTHTHPNTGEMLEEYQPWWSCLAHSRWGPPPVLCYPTPWPGWKGTSASLWWSCGSACPAPLSVCISWTRLIACWTWQDENYNVSFNWDLFFYEDNPASITIHSFNTFWRKKKVIRFYESFPR